MRRAEASWKPDMGYERRQEMESLCVRRLPSTVHMLDWMATSSFFHPPSSIPLPSRLLPACCPRPNHNEGRVGGTPESLLGGVCEETTDQQERVKHMHKADRDGLRNADRPSSQHGRPPQNLHKRSLPESVTPGAVSDGKPDAAIRCAPSCHILTHPDLVQHRPVATAAGGMQGTNTPREATYITGDQTARARHIRRTMLYAQHSTHDARRTTHDKRSKHDEREKRRRALSHPFSTPWVVVCGGWCGLMTWQSIP
ncbi:hypothetical protein B0T25DRAFT_25187 [Lasiosphaeria hispida]|uniref:Uncharacterized protein n=1 Tax=Lasiosphaeria hispida TaxID=260671 RepID=A0AAJ0MJR1_9PEZI|nr:hypothetical protein B0T25DRAFT_25187 [Lasiosphaeria hispida]